MKSAQDSSNTNPAEISKAKSELLFGELLVSKGLLSHRQLIEALNEQHQEGGRLGEVLLRLKMLYYQDKYGCGADSA